MTGLGAVSPIGRSVIENCASVRAGVCRFREWPGYVALTEDPAWDVPDPFVASLVVDVPAGASGPARAWVEPRERSRLGDLFRDLRTPRRTDLARASLFLALPEPDAVSRTWALGPEWGARICARAGLPSIPVVKARAEGSAGSLALLQDVQLHLGRSASELALVIFVDSQHRRGSLAGSWDEDGRLKSARTTDGILPGEAAVAMLIESTSAHARRAPAPLGFVGQVGLGQEPQIRSSNRESSGRGLSDALRGALAGGQPSQPYWCLRSRPSTVRATAPPNGPWPRHGWRRISRSQSYYILPIAWGTSARHTGGILIAQALAGFARGYARVDEAILWASSSEHGLRAAARVTPAR